MIASNPLKAFLLITTMLVSGIVAAQRANPYARPKTGDAMQTRGENMDDLKSFATGGARILDSKLGDITGDGRGGAVLVIDPASTAQAPLGEGAPREVVVLTRDDAGHLQKVASNRHVVPCGTCGGIVGDPYGYMRVSVGQFTIVSGGGSRERWTDEYTFTYDSGKKDWFVATVVRKVMDTETDQEKHIRLTTRELGVVAFGGFDPAHLPDVTLP